MASSSIRPSASWHGPDIPLSHLMQRIRQPSSLRILLLGSSGEPLESEDVALTEVEGASAEDYLVQSGHNLVMMRDTFLTKFGIAPSHIQMEDFTAVHRSCPRTVLQNFVSREDAMEKLVYYCGHGAVDGAWTFSWYPEDNVSILHAQIRPSDFQPAVGLVYVLAQACHSGLWTRPNERFVTWGTSSGPHEDSFGDESGSEWTKWLVGKGAYPGRSVPRQIPAMVAVENVRLGYGVRFRGPDAHGGLDVDGFPRSGTVWMPASAVRHTVPVDTEPSDCRGVGGEKGNAGAVCGLGTVVRGEDGLVAIIDHESQNITRVPSCWIEVVTSQVIDRLCVGMLVSARRPSKQLGSVTAVQGASVEVRFACGVVQALPAGIIEEIFPWHGDELVMGYEVEAYYYSELTSKRVMSAEIEMGTVTSPVLPSNVVRIQYHEDGIEQVVPVGFVQAICSRLVDSMAVGMLVDSFWGVGDDLKIHSGLHAQKSGKTEEPDLGVVEAIEGSHVRISFQEGIVQTVPAGFVTCLHPSYAKEELRPGYGVNAFHYTRTAPSAALMSKDVAECSLLEVLSDCTVVIQLDCGERQEVPVGFIREITSRLVDELVLCMLVRSFRCIGDTVTARTRDASLGVVRGVFGSLVDIWFGGGDTQTVPSNFLQGILSWHGDDLRAGYGVKSYFYAGAQVMSKHTASGSVIELLKGNEVVVQFDDDGSRQVVPMGFVQEINSAVIDELAVGMLVRTLWDIGNDDKEHFGSQSRCADVAVIETILGSYVNLQLQDGSTQSVLAKSVIVLLPWCAEELELGYVVQAFFYENAPHSKMMSRHLIAGTVLDLLPKNEVLIHYEDGNEQVVPAGFVQSISSRLVDTLCIGMLVRAYSHSGSVDRSRSEQAKLGVVKGVQEGIITVCFSDGMRQSLPAGYLEEVMPWHWDEIRVGYCVETYSYAQDGFKETMHLQPQLGTVIGSQDGNRVLIQFHANGVTQNVPVGFVLRIESKFVDELAVGMLVRAYRCGGTDSKKQSEVLDQGVVEALLGTELKVCFREGVLQTVPAGFVEDMLRWHAKELRLGYHVQVFFYTPLDPKTMWSRQPDFGTVVDLLPNNKVRIEFDGSGTTQEVPIGFVQVINSRLIDKVSAGDCVEVYRCTKAEGIGRKRYIDSAVVDGIFGGRLRIRFQDGVVETVPAGCLNSIVP